MTDDSGCSTKAKELLHLLEREEEGELLRARAYHWTGMIVMVLAIVASVAAGLGGLASKFGSQVVGSIALIPGALALLSTTIKFDGRAMWHYRKRIEYRCPLEATKIRVAGTTDTGPDCPHFG